MSDNMRLLSQEEIDTLVEFLTEKRNVSGQVLDQKSIDILVSVLQDQHLMKKVNMAGRTVMPGLSQTLLLDEEVDLILQQQNCRLLFEVNSDGTVSVICKNVNTGKCHIMTPACLEQGIMSEGDGSAWGRAVAPIVFDSIATMLQVEYSRSTFAAVCERYAEIMYGDKDVVLPAIYMPNGNQLMQHMSTE